MPRVIRTTWFADLGYVNVPLFDFKLLRLTPRQFIVLLFSAGLAYWAGTAIMPVFFSDAVYQLFGAAAVFASCAALFVRKGKVFSPEWYLFYFVRRAFGLQRPRPAFPRRMKRGKAAPAAAPRPMVVPLGEPTRIVGVLFDPSTGKRLAHAAYDVDVDGKPYDAGKTDQDGAYSIVFTPPQPGVFNVTIRQRGSELVLEAIRIEVGGGEKTEDSEEKEKRAALKAPAESPRPRERKALENIYTYELFPTNFVSLPDREQDRIVNNFRSFLNSLDVPVKIIVTRSAKAVKLGGTEMKTEYFRFFTLAEEPIDAQLEAAGLSYQRTTESPFIDEVHATRSFVAAEGGRTLRTATVTGLPQTLVEGFLCELYGIVDRIVLNISPLPQGDAVAKVEKHYRIKLGFAYGGRAQQQEVAEGQMAQEALSRLTMGESRLFRIIANIAVGGSSEAELREKLKRLHSYCRGKLIYIDSPLFVQSDLLRGDLGKALFVDTVTLGAFFPFVSADLIETPGGICLGVNRLTGAPVIFDPYLRMNQNIAIIGVTGSGKSFSSKTILTRLMERDPDLAFFIIDPENEYSRAMLPVDLTCQVVHVGRTHQLGLDPFLLFPNSKDMVLEIIADLLGVADDPDRLSELQVAVQKSSSLQELRKGVAGSLRKRVDGLLKGPDGFLFSGKPAPIRDRAIFSFWELHQAMRISKERGGALHLASLLVFGKIWKRIEELPRERLKVVVVDEVWLYTQLPASASFLEYVARRGRKRNVLFLLCSQRPADVFASEKGKAVIENCATKVLLNQDESSAALLKQAFDLTDYEVEQCTSFSPGDAIILSKGIRAPVRIMCTPEEYARFTTKATEVA
ncbi:MAG: ATP-binding protein [Candidatus Hadarchaeum sp.]